MTIHELLKGRSGCACGQEHTCAIRHISIRSGAVQELAALCAGYSHIVLVSDQNTYATCGDYVTGQLAGKLDSNIVFHCDGFLLPDEVSIGRIDSAVTDQTELLIGIGSGVINDLCKYVSFTHGLPYYIVATAPSMDGYASVGAAMITQHMKTTFTTHVPTAIIGDVDILRNAPMRMIQSGFGDIIGKYSALNDWKLAAQLTGEALCPYVYELTYETMRKTERLAAGILQRDPETVQTLMEALVIIGIAMSYTGNSRPASGSEHHLSHYFEITGIVFGREYFLHGIDVAYSTVCTAAMRQRLLETDALPARLPVHDREHWLRAIRRNYGRAAEGVIALQDRCGYYADRYAALYRSQWADIRAILAEMPSAAYIRQLLHTAGLDYAEFEAQYGKPLIQDAMLYAKDLKDRYTFLWIYYLLFSEEMQE